MRKIVIDISGGNVQEMYSTEKENDPICIYVLDWDNIEAGDTNKLSEFPLTYRSKLEMEQIIVDANNKIEQNRLKYE